MNMLKDAFRFILVTRKHRGFLLNDQLFTTGIVNYDIDIDNNGTENILYCIKKKLLIIILFFSPLWKDGAEFIVIDNHASNSLKLIFPLRCHHLFNVKVFYQKQNEPSFKIYCQNFFEVNFPLVHYFAFTYYYTTTCLSFAMNYKLKFQLKNVKKGKVGCSKFTLIFCNLLR